ncbi:hypothetical protein V8C35DRAFT_310052 [Trichoderma chlorosporum]
MPTREFVAESFVADVLDDKGPLLVRVDCRWMYASSTAGEGTQDGYYQALDVLMRISADTPSDNKNKSPACGAIVDLLSACFKKKILNDQEDNEVAIKVILVPKQGYLCRSDILELRMKDSDYIDSIVSFSAPDGYLYSPAAKSAESLLTLLESSPGALILKPWREKRAEIFNLMEDDLCNRLSFSWILDKRPQPRTVALVDGRSKFDMEQQLFAHRGTFTAAQALGISVVVLDRPGHWLQDDAYSHLRDQFIAVDMTIDNELPWRIAEALKGQKIDGIVTYSEAFLIATAQAADILRLPTEPVSAYEMGHDKFKTRQLFTSSDIQALRLENVEQLDHLENSDKLESLQYPLIVKPCRGAGSRGVVRVNNRESLRPAIQRLQEDGLIRNGVLIETYVDGPEIDANFVLYDGEILFFEVSDQLPCDADTTDAGIDETFLEIDMIYPSLLAANEIEMVKTQLYQCLIQLGFRSGVFHLEARVRNSSMQYKNKDGITDLCHTNSTEKGDLSVFLIEVNARPPGLEPAFATAHIYGVDYYALQLLVSIRDKERFAALSQDFRGHAQYHCDIFYVPLTQKNFYVPKDYYAQVVQRLPDLSSSVSYVGVYDPGKTVSPISGIGVVAFFFIFSRQTRREVLEMRNRIQEVSRQILDQANPAD